MSSLPKALLSNMLILSHFLVLGANRVLIELRVPRLRISKPLTS